MNRKTISALSAVSAALVGSSSAAIIASDDFNYTDGALAGQNGGTGWASAWENRIGNGAGNTDQGDAVTSGVATVFGDNSAVFDDQGTTYRNLTSTVAASGSVWVSVDMAFTEGLSTSSFVSLQFRTGDAPATGDPTDNANGAWRVGNEWTSLNWSVSTNTLNSTTTTPTSSTALDNLLVHIDYTAGTSSLWVNSVDGVPLGAADAQIAGTPSSFDTVLLRAGGGGTTFREMTLDNLTLATLESDVRTIPEPATTGLLGLSGLALLLRRRK